MSAAPASPATAGLTHYRLISLLAERHRVFAADLRGFGDSRVSEDDYDSAAAAEDLHQLIVHLGAGPVHLTGQDISGGTVFRLAATRPGDIRSFTAIEMGLAGFGLEGFADVTHAGPGISAFSPRPASPRCCSPAVSASSSGLGRSRQ